MTSNEIRLALFLNLLFDLHIYSIFVALVSFFALEIGNMKISLEIPTCVVLVSMEQFVFVWFIQSPCKSVFEIVRVHWQHEFFNIQKVVWAWGAKKWSQLNWNAPQIFLVFPFLNLLSRCSQIQSKLQVVELISNDFIFSCLEGILRFI